MAKPKLLLHACCAPCSGYLASELSRDYTVAIFYFNPNIHPKKEYERRSGEAERFFQKEKIEFIWPKYDHPAWLSKAKVFAKEPERGLRCQFCYFYRLRATAQYAKENGFDFFGSTLAISPHKDAEAINNLGAAIEKQIGIKFLAGDWKKNDGSKKAMNFSREQGFYHQNYCGCEFSIRD